MYNRRVTLRRSKLRFKKNATTSRGSYSYRDLWYIEAQVREGSSLLYGIGECAPLPDLSPDCQVQFLSVLAEAAADYEQSGMVPYRLLQKFPAILMGFETLHRSLQGSRIWKNPYQHTDTPFARGETGIRINGLVWMGSFEQMLEELNQKINAGFRCIKLKIGAIDFEQEILLLQQIRSHFDSSLLEIRLDANGAFTPQEALDKLSRLARFDIHSIEQPIKAKQWDSLALLCRISPIPIALDEELIGIFSTFDKAQLLDRIRPQYIVLKPTLHGGFSGSEEWMKMADTRGIKYWITSALESNVGLNAIAQWATEHCRTIDSIPQGLGTGQLFEHNFPHIIMDIKGEWLWNRTLVQQQFDAEVTKFRHQWFSDSPTMLAYTSGSTGQPKPFELLKTRMQHSAISTINYFGLNKESRILLCLPLHYIAGKMQLLRQILSGGELIAVAPSRRPLRNLQKTPTFAAMTPMQVMHTLDHKEDKKIFSQIDTVLIGGGAIPPELEKRLQSEAPQCFSSYGMTETYSHIALRRINYNTDSTRAYHPLPGISISQDSNNCLQISAPSLCDEILTTNDIVDLTSEGGFHILGRRDNVVCSGGIKLHIEQIEDKLSDLPIPILLTAVPHSHLGEALVLLYEATATDQSYSTTDLRKQCENRLQDYECPQYFFKVSQLPFTATNKPDRQQAKKLALRLQELDSTTTS